MEKYQFCGFFKLMFLWSKIGFLRFIRWEYRELQGVTGDYKGLDEVIRGERGLQRVTGGDRG